MVRRQVPEREVHPAAVTVAFLPSVEGMAVRAVVRELPEVGSFRDVRPSDDLAEGPVLVSEASVYQRVARQSG